MTERESKQIPDMAEQEKVQDLAWLGENANVLSAIAEFGYVDHGRGVVIVDERTQPNIPAKRPQLILLGDVPEDLIQFDDEEIGDWYYLPLKKIEKHQWEDGVQMAKEYDPKREFVAILLMNDRENAYRIGIPPPKKS